jgi:manganese oxidase
MNISRRFFLTGGLLTGAFAVQAQEESKVKLAVVSHDHTKQIDESDPIQHALNQKVTKLKGFEPQDFLTNFDYGKVSKLSDGRNLREFNIVAQDVNLEIAPGIFFPAWTYNGTVPGPTIRCREGDLVKIYFKNQSLTDHTIHLHGIHPAAVDGITPVVKPNETFVYEFTAEPFGLQFYHCHVPPVTLHMNRGLFGGLIIDPKTPRPPATEFIMITHAWDTNFDMKNEIYAVNGAANFYRDNPIKIKVNEQIRLFLINATEYEPINSFHLHANFFNVFRTGSKLTPDDFTDMVTLAQAERCVIEFSFKYPGLYMFHAHQNYFAEMGWMGHFEVTP